jgi:hypothetical protein
MAMVESIDLSSGPRDSCSHKLLSDDTSDLLVTRIPASFKSSVMLPRCATLVPMKHKGKL